MKTSEQKPTSVVVAKVNDVSILVGDTSEKLVPIKPICMALGIDDKAQKNRIERDEIFNSVKVITTSTGSDGKVYNMLHLPLREALGWIYSIDHNSVKPEAKEAVIKFKKQCAEVLYDHFILREKFLSEQNEEFLKLDEEEYQERRLFQSCKERISNIRSAKHEVRMRRFEDWKFDRRQQTIPFPETTHENQSVSAFENFIKFDAVMLGTLGFPELRDLALAEIWEIPEEIIFRFSDDSSEAARIFDITYGPDDDISVYRLVEYANGFVDLSKND